MFRKSLVLLALALALGSLAGCKKAEDQVVATVGNHAITVGELEKQYNPIRLGTPEEMMEEKRKALDLLTKEKLQLNEAEARGYGEKEELKQMLEDRKRVLVVNQLYTVEIVNRVKIPESELNQIYQMMGQELDLKHILVEKEEDAKAILGMIRQGASFDSLAKERSTDAMTKEKGGALGVVAWGRTSEQVYRAAYKLSEGQVSEPVKDSAGWHILMLVSRKPVENQRPFEEQKKQIESRLKQVRMREMSDKYLEDLKGRIGITYKDDVLKTLAEKAPAEPPSPFAPAPLPQVTDEERNMVLVGTKKGDWTVGKVMDLAVKVPPRGSLGSPEGIKQWVDMLILQEELVQEALRKGLDKSKEVRDEMTRMYEIQMVNLLHRDEVESKAKPTDEEMKAHFEADPDRYAQPERNTVSMIVMPAEDQAKNVLKSLRKGADFEKLAKEKSIHPSKSRGGNIGLVMENRNPDIFRVATALKAGQLSEPFKFEDGWAIIKLTKREAKKARTLEEVKRQVERDLNYQKLLKADEEFIASLRTKYPVKVNEKVLEQVGKKAEEELKKKEEESKKEEQKPEAK